MSRIGIFAGSFDPVHKGHIAFALKAIQEAKLDAVYFLPEIKPRRKAGASHISRRIAMLELGLKPYQKLKLLELPDKQFSVAHTMPRLEQKFASSEMFLLMGADGELEHLPNWPLAKQLLARLGLVIAYRGKTREEVAGLVKKLPSAPASLYLIESSKPNLSSAKIRAALQKGKTPDGLPDSVQTYIANNWLYGSVGL